MQTNTTSSANSYGDRSADEKKATAKEQKEKAKPAVQDTAKVPASMSKNRAKSKDVVRVDSNITVVDNTQK